MVLALKAMFYTIQNRLNYCGLNSWSFCTYHLCSMNCSALADICEHAFCSLVKHNIYNFYICSSLIKLYVHALTTYSENYVLNCGADTEIFVRCVQGF